MTITPKFYKSIENSILEPQYESKQYVEQYLKPHMKRFVNTMSLLVKIYQPGMRVIDVGSYGSLVPVLKDVLELPDINCTEPYQEGKLLSEEVTLPPTQDGKTYTYHVDRFDIENLFPYKDNTFDIVIFTEVLEHISLDPMHVISEINRITKQGGWILLSTPNCSSLKSIWNILRGGNPILYPVFNREPSRDRHNREYVPWEVISLLRDGGYNIDFFKTVNVYSNQIVKLLLFKTVLLACSVISFALINPRHRGDTIFALAKKTSGITNRYPYYIYS